VPKIPTLALAALLLVTTEADATRPTKGRPIKTGQTTSRGPGSDGDLQKGLSPMLKDLGNGVIKDQRTGLFWEKKSDDASIHDKDFSYSWGQGVSPYPMNGTMVTVFLASLNTPPCFGGFCDWRIPNIRELLSLVDYGTPYPKTFGAFDTGCAASCTVKTCSCTRDGRYWSSTSDWAGADYAWYVNFSFGNGGTAGKTTNYYVRAVRGGS